MGPGTEASESRRGGMQGHSVKMTKAMRLHVAIVWRRAAYSAASALLPARSGEEEVFGFGSDVRRVDVFEV
jgi:hypothetical protein